MNKFMIILLVIISPVSAGIYKWTDENGNVHFGDQPVDKESATELNIRIDNHTGVSNSSGNKKEREFLLKQIDEEQEAHAEKRKKRIALNKKYRKLCNNYKRRYQSHIQSSKTFIMSPDGERTYYSDKQRAEKLKSINKGIAKYCH